MSGLQRLFIMLLTEKEKIMYSVLMPTIGLKYDINVNKCSVFKFMGISLSTSFQVSEYWWKICI